MDSKEKTLWVGNLHENVTDELLYELFLQAGPLEKVALPKDKDGKNKRFAFITFKHETSIPYTIKIMEGITLCGQQIKMAPRTGSSYESPTNTASSPLLYNSNLSPHPYNAGSSPHAYNTGLSPHPYIPSFLPNPYNMVSPPQPCNSPCQQDQSSSIHRSHTWPDVHISDDSESRVPNQNRGAVPKHQQNLANQVQSYNKCSPLPWFGQTSHNMMPQNLLNMQPIESRRQRVLQRSSITLDIHRNMQPSTYRSSQIRQNYRRH